MDLPDYSAAKVLVVGDLMLDQYWHGSTSRISPEAPVPVVHVKSADERPGGAGNVALNIAALGAEPIVFGFCGNDDAAGVLVESLENSGVDCRAQIVNDCATITKLRILSRHQQLIRLDFEDGFHHVSPTALLQDVKTQLHQSNVIVLSDYGKGTLNKVTEFIELARAAAKTILVDPKGTDFSIYRRASIITPNLSEFEAVVGSCRNEQQIVEKGEALIRKLQLDALLVTRGEQGMSLISREHGPLHLPTDAREVYDVTGAGDTVISVLAASMAANKPLSEATRLANLAAGIVVKKMGTATTTAEELNYALQGQRAHHRGIIDLSDLLHFLEGARSNGEKIVATNGCFDLLHPGHLRYLQQAKSLGDRLVVLINSDSSIKRLKGLERPINELKHRMEMVAALECVDWVIPFHEDTPKNIICRILPDVLVKGGDYTDVTQIAGHECVLAKGGEVKFLDYIDGLSTSKIIDSIRRKSSGVDV